MTTKDILQYRFANEHLSQQRLSSPADMVQHLTAVQSQDYPGAKWALAQRLMKVTEQDLDEAFNKGEILRTHVLRSTWHFVHPDDIVWMEMLTGQRVKQQLAYYDKQLDVTQEVIKKVEDIFEDALKNKTYLNRTQLGSKLKENGIEASGQKLGHLLMHAELDGLICSGPRVGRQFTYALTRERAPQAKTLTYEQALAELTKRYFTSHGPATIKDFSWWSGLPATEVKKGIELNNDLVKKEIVGNLEFWYVPRDQTPEIPKHVFLLPNYDEFAIAYKDRDLFFDPAYAKTIDMVHERMFVHMIMQEGKIIGMWRKEVKKGTVEIQSQFFEEPSTHQKTEFEKAAHQYGGYLGLKAVIA